MKYTHCPHCSAPLKYKDVDHYWYCDCNKPLVYGMYNFEWSEMYDEIWANIEELGIRFSFFQNYTVIWKIVDSRLENVGRRYYDTQFDLDWENRASIINRLKTLMTFG